LHAFLCARLLLLKVMIVLSSGVVSIDDELFFAGLDDDK
jgi:hypothetical protein